MIAQQIARTADTGLQIRSRGERESALTIVPIAKNDGRDHHPCTPDGPYMSVAGAATSGPGPAVMLPS